jgi:vacuolar protein sorting-associated protein 16
MAPSNPLADWERVGDKFYRKVRVYDAVFDDDLELENLIVAGAPYGGAVGILFNQDQVEIIRYAAN